MDERVRLFDARLAALRTLLERHSAGALVLRKRRDFAWLTVGGQSHVLLATAEGTSPIVITAGDAVALTPVNEHRRIVDEELAGLPLRAESLPWWDERATDEAIAGLAGGGRVLEDTEVAGELTELRAVLAGIERTRMAELATDVRAAMGEGLGALRPGMSEHEVGAMIESRLAAAGARVPVLLAAADERIDRYRHPLPTATPVRQRLMVVVVAERFGLHVAHTEFAELEPRPAHLQRRADGLSAVLAAMRGQSVPGNTLAGVLRAARAAYGEQGMADEWTLHHQGGTIGYQAREKIATPADETLIRAGMALAWNPSAIGFKLEETLLLDDAGGQRVLTTTSTTVAEGRD
jgi:Xaa-Pro dipeptidase